IRPAPRPPSSLLLRSRLQQRAPRPHPENPPAGASSVPAAERRERDLKKSRAPSYSITREKSRLSSIFKYFQHRGNMAELQLDREKTALVLIDLENAVVGMNPGPHTAAQV